MASFNLNQQEPPWLTNQHEPPWVPLETKKDCSQGICSFYCPQLCYILYPPPPPYYSFNEDDDSPTFSPVVIAIIGILASAVLLVTYYTFISKFCGGFRRSGLQRNRVGANNNSHAIEAEGDDDDDEDDGGDGNQSHHRDTWYILRPNGLDEALINKIAVCRYKRGEGLIEGTDCSVCLSEFQEGENLRLLPKCNHAFHLQCIDTWLRSHSNCPLCRANIVSVNPLPPPQLPSAAPVLHQSEVSHPEAEEGESNGETIVAIEDLVGMNRELGEDMTSKETQTESTVDIMDDDDSGEDGSESDNRSYYSMDSSHVVSVADIPQRRMEDDYGSFSVGSSGSCSRVWGGKSRKNLH